MRTVLVKTRPKIGQVLLAASVVTKDRKLTMVEGCFIVKAVFKNSLFLFLATDYKGEYFPVLVEDIFQRQEFLYKGTSLN